MSQDAVVSMYAEYLPKLGRLSIVVHLPTPSNEATKALISNNNNNKNDDEPSSSSRLVVVHDGHTFGLTLPANTPQAPSLGVIPPGLGKLSCGLRVPAVGLGRGTNEEATTVLWSAADLVPGVDVVCRGCGAVVVEGEERLKAWKDLPSENWAEMMEFWHCHKPTVKTNGNGNGSIKEEGDKASEEALASRGYGANSAIVAQPGVGFVDLITMLFHPDDCRCKGLTKENNEEEEEFANTPAARPSAASCPDCGTQLGHFDNRKGGASLFKWKLDILAVKDDTIKVTNTNPPTLSQCLAAALVANQARSGSAKVVLQGETEAITVWVLNPHVKFASLSKKPSPSSPFPAAAMKLLYREQAMEEEDEINLPNEAIQEIRQTLQQGTTWLPPDEKSKQFSVKEDPWMVTLLER